MSKELRGIINGAADNIHDATRWDQRDEAGDDGQTPMDRLVERIERLYAGRQLFVVGRLIEKPDEHEGHTWEICGVFSTPDKADAACATPNHFYGSEVLDLVVDGPPIPWPDCVWPRRES